MADGKVTDFDVATTVEATDKLYLVRAGDDYQVTPVTLFANVPGPFRTLFPMYLGGTPQTLAEGGVVTVTQTTTRISNTGAVALTIDDGLFDGQIKIILTTGATSTSTLSGANLAITSVVFDAVGESAVLFWQGGAWWPLSGTATFNP